MKPSERLRSHSKTPLTEAETAYLAVLDEHHGTIERTAAAVLELQRAQPVPSLLDCGLCRGRHIEPTCPMFATQRAQTPSAGGSEGDALAQADDLLEWLDNGKLNQSAIARRVRFIISAMEAERASHREIYRDYRVALQNEKEALTAEQRAHGETKASLGIEIANAADYGATIAQLQRELGERTRERDDANEDLKAKRRERDEAKAALELHEAGSAELLRQRDEARENAANYERLFFEQRAAITTLTADRDRLQAELDGVRGELEEARRCFALADRRVKEGVGREVDLAQTIDFQRREISVLRDNLRAQSSDGLREALVGYVESHRSALESTHDLSEFDLGRAQVWRYLTSLLAAHPAPAEVSGEEAGRDLRVTSPTTADVPTQMSAATRLHMARALVTDTAQEPGHTPTPAPASAEMLAERVRGRLGEQARASTDSANARLAYQHAQTIVTEELAALNMEAAK